MKKTIPTCALFLALLLWSCDGNVTYKKFVDDFPENRWEKSDVKTYDFKIEQAGNYDLLIDFSHVYGMQFAQLPINVTLTNPDKTATTEKFALELRDKDGKDLGDCSGDYCDLRQAVFENRKLEAGNYIVTLANGFDFEYFPNVIGLGIRVVPSKN